MGTGTFTSVRAFHVVDVSIRLQSLFAPVMLP
jgi:hypothetical protein